MQSCTMARETAPSFGELFETFRSSISGHPGGAIVSFTGTVRRDAKGTADREVKTIKIEIEAIEGVSSEHLQQISTDMEARPGIVKAMIVHYTGKFDLGEPMVHVLVCAEHRQEGFKALEDIVNRYKKETPLWKREWYSDGTFKWIEH
jgi:molybdopterin synthase catalytic subunit